MTNKPLLSICVPTYNRAKYLKDTLDSILRQIDNKNKDKVEICISDNASEDNTEELVGEYQKKSPIPITYHKNEKNMGADYNFLKVAEISNSEYFWFLGSDDIIEEGGIDYILREIEEDGNISMYIINANVYDYNMHNVLKKSENPELLKVLNKYRTDININDIDTFLDFFMYYGYISAMVVNKNRWDDILRNEKNIELYFNIYVHLYVVSKIFLKYGHFKYVSRKYIGSRSGNDSFLESNNQEGMIKRAYLNLHGYEKIARALFGKGSVEYKRALTPIARSMRGYVWFVKREACLDKSLRFFLDCVKCYYLIPSFWIYIFPYIIMPKQIYLIGRFFYHKIGCNREPR